MASYDFILKSKKKDLVIDLASFKGEPGEGAKIVKQDSFEEEGKTGVKITWSDGSVTKVFNGEKPKKGIDFDDGVSPTISTKGEVDGVLLTIKDINGTKTEKIKHGEKGDKGDPLSIVSEKFDEKGNTVVTFNNKEESTFTVQKGKDAAPLTVKNKEFDSEGNTIVTLSDGNKFTVNKGKDGSIDISEWTEDQKESFRQGLEIPEPDLSGYAKKEDLNSYQPKGNYAKSDDLNLKADAEHTHLISDVKDLNTSLESKADKSHTHNISDINNLQTELDTKQNKGDYALKSDLNNYQPVGNYALKTDLGDYQAKGDYALKSDLNSKANVSHSHNLSDIKDINNFLVNDLTTGGEDKALSAEQGKVLFQYANDGKNKIASAIVGKGGEASSEDSFESLAGKIAAIKPGYGVGDIINISDIKVLSNTKTKAEKVWESSAHSTRLESIIADSKNNIYSGSNGLIVKQDIYSNVFWIFKGMLYEIRGLGVDSKDNLYACSSGDNAMKIDSVGQKIWEYKGPNVLYALGVDSNDYVYIAGRNGVITKLTNSGSKVWEVTNHTDIIQSLAIDSKNNIYTGGYDNKLIKTNNNGGKEWEFTEYTHWVSSVVVDSQDNVYGGSWDQRLVKVSNTGNKIREYKVGAMVTSMAINKNDDIYANKPDYNRGKVLIINSKGELLWDFGVDNDNMVVSVDALKNIYVGGENKKMTKMTEREVNEITGYEVLR